MKPAQYAVEFGQPTEEDEDPTSYRKESNFKTLKAARDFYDKVAAKNQGPVLYERVNLTDVTPEEDPPGILWSWDRKYVEEGE